MSSNGGSQTVRLPQSLVRRVGEKAILEPADEWTSEFVAALGAWDEEIERPHR